MTSPLEQVEAFLNGEKIAGPDGIVRDRQQEHDLNAIAAKMAAVPGADRVLAWLKSITVNVTHGPGVTDAQLRHHSGQCYVAALILRRIEDGRNGKPTANPAPVRPQRRRRKPAAPAA
jgi:hypothetical protein